MTSITFLFIFVAIVTTVFLVLNFLFAPHNPYQEKYSIFECGFHNFLGQNRIQFGIKFFIFALVYLLLDLEILIIYPYGVSEYENKIYGLLIVVIFILIITAGFVFEIGKNALKIESRQSLIHFFKLNIFFSTNRQQSLFLYRFFISNKDFFKLNNLFFIKESQIKNSYYKFLLLTLFLLVVTSLIIKNNISYNILIPLFIIIYDFIIHSRMSFYNKFIKSLCLFANISIITLFVSLLIWIVIYDYNYSFLDILIVFKKFFSIFLMLRLTYAVYKMEKNLNNFYNLILTLSWLSILLYVGDSMLILLAFSYPMLDFPFNLKMDGGSKDDSGSNSKSYYDNSESGGKGGPEPEDALILSFLKKQQIEKQDKVSEKEIKKDKNYYEILKNYENELTNGTTKIQGIKNELRFYDRYLPIDKNINNDTVKTYFERHVGPINILLKCQKIFENKWPNESSADFNAEKLYGIVNEISKEFNIPSRIEIIRILALEKDYLVPVPPKLASDSSLEHLFKKDQIRVRSGSIYEMLKLSHDDNITKEIAKFKADKSEDFVKNKIKKPTISEETKKWQPLAQEIATQLLKTKDLEKQKEIFEQEKTKNPNAPISFNIPDEKSKNLEKQKEFGFYERFKATGLKGISDFNNKPRK